MKKYQIREAFHEYLNGKRSYHLTNFNLLLKNPRPIPDHTDFMAALEAELAKIAYYDELVRVHNEI